MRNSTATDVGPLTVSLANGTTGIRSIDSIQYTTPPGGLHCAYLIKPLATCLTGDHLVAVEKEFATKNGFTARAFMTGPGWAGLTASALARRAA